jgi:hypothetical protein
LNDAVLLGEAMYCRPVNGEYHVGIELCGVRRTCPRSVQNSCELSELCHAARA